MKIVITGATGFIGQQLVPLLLERGHNVNVVGRDPLKVGMMFPQVEACTYEEVSSKLKDCDVFLHLAVVNNDQFADQTKIDNVNIDLALSMARAAKTTNVRKFIFVSSTQALDASIKSSYAVSKRIAVEKLKALELKNLTTVYLPLVYGASWPGSLKWLNGFPDAISRPVFHVLASLKPTLHVSKLADFLERTDVESTAARVILSNDIDDNFVYCAWKKGLDIVAGLGIILFLWWMIVILVLFIRLESRGPGIFAQKRVGMKGDAFTCYKLRTMVDRTPQVGTHDVSSASVTKIGSFLRRYKLDELPQAWNLLKGNMSLVGPRPCLPTQTALINKRHAMQVLEILPGITGLSQVRGIDMSDPQKLATSDHEYLHTRSILMELKIILSTIKGSGGGDRVTKT